MLLIITFRPEFLPQWIGHPHVTMFTVYRLSSQERAEMIKGVMGGKFLPKEIADQISERTDGIPLFIEELTKTVIESGLLRASGDHYEITGPVTQLSIPNSLQASLLARLDRLAPVREIAQIGATFGRRFTYELISAVVPLTQQQLDLGLEQLVRCSCVAPMRPNAEYTFKHALVQDVAYSTLLRSRRAQLHGQIASVLEARFPEIVQMQPELLAQHCTEAGLTEKAIQYCLKAGQQAMAPSAMDEAETQLRKGLELLASLPDGNMRQQYELNLLSTVGQALIAIRGCGATESSQLFSRAHQIAASPRTLDANSVWFRGISISPGGVNGSETLFPGGA